MTLFVVLGIGLFGGGDAPSSPDSQPLPPQPPTSFRPSEVERAVARMQRASISYNAPTDLHLGETVEIQLLLAPRRTVAQLKDELTAIGERRGRQIKFSNRMEARLTGSSFKIESIGSELRAVNPGTTTAWRWEVEPTEAGQHELHLTLSALLFVEGVSTPYEVETFDTEIKVNVTWFDRAGDFVSGNWTWLWSVILFPLGAWLVHNRRRWLWRFRSAPPPAPPS
jgi:hypothetical protein